MYQKEYFVPKRSGTLADPLLAYGLATVLHAIVANVPGRRPNQLHRVSIVDTGACYTIRLSESIREEWIGQSKLKHDMARPVLRIAKPKEITSNTPKKTKPEKKPLPETVAPIDYNKIWDDIRAVNALIDAQRQNKRVTREEIVELRASHQTEYRDRDVALLIGDYRMQVESIHNQAVTQWVQTLESGYQAANVRAILSMFSTLDADLTAVAKVWAKEVKLDSIKLHLTASQVYNPSMGKGQNQPKANRLTLSNKKMFWLVEYLKAVGLFVSAVPYAFNDEGMRKTYVLEPANIELGTHRKIFEDFKRTIDGTGASPIKTDVLISLDYAATYLSYCRAAKIADVDDNVVLNPRNTVHGFAVAEYLSLSKNSYTMINLSSLGLPPWLNKSVQTSEDATAVQEIIDEHKVIIRDMKEKKPDGSPHPERQRITLLLDSYRDFLTGHRSAAFFDFCAGYGEYVVRALLDSTRIRQMRVLSLDEIFRRLDMPDENHSTAKDDLTIFTSTSEQYPGFHRIAYAIRHSTVIPQRRNANYKSGQRSEKSLYDVRYGLGNNLRRKTDNASDFIEALSEFVHAYNAETEQVFENTIEERKRDPQNYARTHYRQRVLISDLDDVLALVKQRGPHLVCNMLVAYGYATAGTKGNETSQNDEDAGNDEEDIENAQQGANR